MLAGLRPPSEADSVNAVQACYCPRSYEYNMLGVLPLAIYSRYLENTRVKLLTSSTALLELLAGHPERIMAIRSQRWEIIGAPVMWLGEGEILCEASLASATPRSIVLRTGLRLSDDSRVIVKGYAVLVVIDTRLKKAATIPEDHRARLLAGAAPVDIPAPVSLPGVSLTEPGVVSTSFVARYSDMDSNRHLNQARYVEFIENIVADCLHGILRISEEERTVISQPYTSFHIEYQAEVKYPSRVTVAMKIQDSAAYFSIFRLDADGAPNFEAIRARLSFAPPPKANL